MVSLSWVDNGAAVLLWASRPIAKVEDENEGVADGRE